MEEVDLPKCSRVGTQNVVDFASMLRSRLFTRQQQSFQLFHVKI